MSTPPETRQYVKKFVEIEALRKNWGWFLFLGLIFIGLGTFAVASSAFVTVVSIVLLGTILLISGAVQIIYAFFVHQWSGFFLSLLAGILYTIFGLMLTVHPEAGALTITLLLAAFYIIGGLFLVGVSVATRFDQWGWALFSGLIKFALGALIWAGWPETGHWVLGLFIGIDMIFFGWFWVAIALAARNAPRFLR